MMSNKDNIEDLGTNSSEASDMYGTMGENLNFARDNLPSALAYKNDKEISNYIKEQFNYMKKESTELEILNKSILEFQSTSKSVLEMCEKEHLPDQIAKENIIETENDHLKQIRVLTDSLEKYKNKLTEKNANIQTLIEKQNISEQENLILKHKYNFIKNEYDRLTEELFNVKIYNNNNNSLTEQNNILLNDNTTLTNDLYDAKKLIHILTQKLKFSNIEHTVLSEYHDKYKKESEQTIQNLKIIFGLVNDEPKVNSLNENLSNNKIKILEKEEKDCIEDEDIESDANSDTESDKLVTIGKIKCLKLGNKYYKYVSGKKGKLGKLYANTNSDGTVSLVK